VLQAGQGLLHILCTRGDHLGICGYKQLCLQQSNDLWRLALHRALLAGCSPLALAVMVCDMDSAGLNHRNQVGAARRVLAASG
jgi:hypothetical protein